MPTLIFSLDLFLPITWHAGPVPYFFSIGYMFDLVVQPRTDLCSPKYTVLLQSIEDPGISNPILFSRWLVCKKLCLFSTPTWRQNHSIWPPTTWFFFEMGSFRYTVAIYILESKNVCWKTHLTKKTGVVTTSLVGSQRIFAGAGGGFFFDKRLKVVRCPFWTHINWNNSRSFRCEMGLRQLSLDHVPYMSDHTVWICLDILV